MNKKLTIGLVIMQIVALVTTVINWIETYRTTVERNDIRFKRDNLAREIHSKCSWPMARLRDWKIKANDIYMGRREPAEYRHDFLDISIYCGMAADTIEEVERIVSNGL